MTKPVTVFTNGCFDLLHPGHIHLLEYARSLGGKLIVGLNSDTSVRKLKGEGRPLMAEQGRAAVLRAIRFVDEVVIFDEATPARLIGELEPDILVKGADWAEDQIAGSDLLLARGGRVERMPLLTGWSSSSLVEAAAALHQLREPLNGDVDDFLSGEVTDLMNCLRITPASCSVQVKEASELIRKALRGGSTIFACGNGGSAAMAQHLVTELVGGSGGRHPPGKAFALTADSTLVTALSNDLGFSEVFSAQLKVLASPGDVLIALSTSGLSRNILAAVESARGTGCKTICLTGASGELADLCDIAIKVPSEDTRRIQEVHDVIIHVWCCALEPIDRPGNLPT